MKNLLAAFILLIPSSVFANDWFAKDKQKHFVISAALGSASYAYTQDRGQAFALALLPGLAKELADSQQEGNQFSGQDMAWNAAGALLGVQLGHWFITPNQIAYSTRF